MSAVEWRLKGREFINCNCDYGCPCQFNALPTAGDCHGIGAVQVDEGHFGDTPLDGLRAAWILSWPGAIHEGGGSMQAIIDERADGAQRTALAKIVHGEETEPGATIFQVLAGTFATIHDPLFKPVDFEIDVENRTARLSVPGIAEGRGEPIRNPVTGEAHRARIDLPHGFEYAVAEIASGTSRVQAFTKLDLTDSHGHFAHVHWTRHGVVR